MMNDPVKLDNSLVQEDIDKILKELKSTPELFVYRGYVYKRIKNSLRNYKAGDVVYYNHKRKGHSLDVLGFAVKDYTWRDDYIVVTMKIGIETESQLINNKDDFDHIEVGRDDNEPNKSS
jgi:hypothetical protein